MTVTIIGGGASGLIAAIIAAQQGNTVTVLERQSRVGRKLLATGNGRCNLTNLNLTMQNYHGQAPDFARHALSMFDPKATMDFFSGLGLITVTERSGKVYPLSDQAGSVLDVLRLAANELGVDTKTGFEVCSIVKQNPGFKVSSKDDTLTTDKLIICCGGMAGAKLGGTKSGYELLKSMGHSTTELFPALVQIKTDNTYVKALKGIRADADIKLEKGGKTIASSSGEVQFTEYGVSGPAIFEISRAAATERGGQTLTLDLMRPLTLNQLEQTISARIKKMPGLNNEDLLTGILHNRLGRTVLRYAGYDLTAPISILKDKDISKISLAVKQFTISVIDTLGFEGAQVTAGGVKTSEFNPETLESLLIPELYAAGEVLDIDGDCGGYNLQWAWASGYLAGQTL